jgi:hypothetical protein
LAKTKGEILDNHGELLRSVVWKRWNLHNSGVAPPDDAAKLVEEGWCDGVAVMVKGEPHSRKKLSQRRYRIICLVSIADEILDRMLSEEQNELEIDHWAEIPSKPGMGMTDDQARALLGQLPRGPIDSADVSGWDFCVQEWHFDFDDRCRARMAGVDYEHVYFRCLRSRSYVLCRSLFVLSDGTCFAQKKPGVMKSGWLRTASTNSRVRVAMAYFIGCDWAAAMGDDSMETPVEGKAEKYARYGIRYEQAVVPEGYVEFCSHLWDLDRQIAVPQNWAKLTFRLLGHNPDLGLLAQYQYELRHSPMLQPLTEMLIGIGWDPIKLHKEKLNDEEEIDDSGRSEEEQR